jgi:hypothetical protein
MNTRLFLCGILALLGLAQRATSTTLLDSISAPAGVGTVQPNANTSLSILFAIGPIFKPCFVVGTCADVALLQGITSASDGTKITIDPNSSNFAALVAALSIDGEYLWVGVVPGPSYGTSSGGAEGFGLPNFSGDTISSLVLTIDNVTIHPQPPGTEFGLTFGFNIYGASLAPEPSSGLGALAGFCVLIALKRVQEPCR